MARFRARLVAPHTQLRYNIIRIPLALVWVSILLPPSNMLGTTPFLRLANSLYREKIQSQFNFGGYVLEYLATRLYPTRLDSTRLYSTLEATTSIYHFHMSPPASADFIDPSPPVRASSPGIFSISGAAGRRAGEGGMHARRGRKEGRNYNPTPSGSATGTSLVIDRWPGLHFPPYTG